MQEPIFPLQIVTFPGELVNLHIFEPRYRELIADSKSSGLHFVIVPYIDGKIMNMGTRVFLHEIVQTYEDGRLDIRVKGTKRVLMTDIVNPMDDKLYAGASTVEVVDESKSDAFKNDQIHALVLRFQELVKAEKTIIVGRTFNTYDIAPKVGLSLTQKYELLELSTESERQDFLIEHLQQIIPVIGRIEDAKLRIRMNGHFPSYKGPDLDF